MILNVDVYIIYKRQCDYILKLSTDKETENLLRQIEKFHGWAEKERNDSGSTMGHIKDTYIIIYVYFELE